VPQKRTYKKPPPIILSIAGFDPSSGAGITADIKTVSAHGCYGLACITALTVQSTQGVKQVKPVEDKLIAATLKELASDFSIDAVKIGMLGSAESVLVIADFLERHSIKNVVLDPVLKSSSGANLLSDEGLKILRRRLLPLADVITPNIDEASAMTGLAIHQANDMQPVAGQLHKLGAKNVVITGGHLDPPVDFLSWNSGKQHQTFTHKIIKTSSTHGTGCAFSTAIACNLAKGKALTEAVRQAKQYVTSALQHAVPIGKGAGPVNHMWKNSS